MEENIVKQENYAIQKPRLKKALKYEFFVEALAIEYAIIEDRVQSILKSAGYSIIKSSGQKYSLYENLYRMKTSAFFKRKDVKNIITLDFINEIDKWRKDRNTIIHKLLSTKFKPGEFRKLAMQGDKLQKQIDNKANRIKTYMKKINKE